MVKFSNKKQKIKNKNINLKKKWVKTWKPKSFFFGQHPINKARKRKFMFLKANKIFRNFYFSIYKNYSLVYKNRLKYIQANKQLIKKFYNLVYKTKLFTKSANLTYKEVKNTILTVEKQLITSLIRSGFVPKRAIALALIRNGFVFVNKQRIYDPFFSLRLGDMIKIDSIVWYNLLKRLKIRPKQSLFYECDYKTGTLILFRLPKTNLLNKYRFFKLRIIKQLN